MAIRYPLGEQDFESIRKEGKVYIDKTGLIYELINSYKYVFLSRPRRFGKSLLLSTIKSYFQGKRELFEGLKIYDLEKEWNYYPVIHLLLSRNDAYNPLSLKSLLSQQISLFEEELNISEQGLELSQRFSKLIISLFKKAGKKVVILIDEYDNPLVNTLHLPDIHEQNKSLLKSVYSNIKDLDHYIQFAMLTGVSRFTNTSIFSGINNLTDISFDKEYSTICGFTEQELADNLSIGVISLSREFGISESEAFHLLKKEYDGYHFAKDLTDIYNPYSVLNCLAKKDIDNYWIKSGTPTFLVKKLEEHPVSFMKIFNGRASELQLSERDTIFSSPVSLMYQTGYLTIKDYDSSTHTYTLRIPNLEIEKSLGSELFQQMIGPHKLFDNDILIGMLHSLKEGKPDEFFKRLKSFIANVPGVINHRDMVELNFENLIYVILLAMVADVRAEQTVSNGRIDFLIKTDKNIYVIELKFNSTPKKAIEQIEKKEYSLAYEYDGRKIFKIGANFSSKTKNLTGWKIVE